MGDNLVMKSFPQEEGRGLRREKTAKPTLRGGGREGEGIYHAELDEDIGFCGLF